MRIWHFFLDVMQVIQICKELSYLCMCACLCAREERGGERDEFGLGKMNTET